MLPRPRTSRRIAIPRRAILPAALTTAPSRILAAAVTEGETAAATGAVIAAGVAVGDAVADALAADAHRVAQAGAICLPRNMHRHKVASPADLRIAADSRVATITGVRMRRAAQRLP